MTDWGDFADESTQVRALPFVGADRVLVADADPHTRTWLRDLIGGVFGLEEVDNGRHALERLATDPPRVFIVGAQLSDVSGSVLLGHAARHGLLSAATGGPVTFTVADLAGQSAQVDESVVQIYFRLDYSITPERARELISQALAHVPAPQPKRPTEADAMLVREVVEHAKRLGMQPDLKSSAAAAVTAVVSLVKADRVRCLYYDDEGGMLWSELDEEPVEHAASQGIAGFAVRAKSSVVLAKAKADPAYRPEIDDPEGNGNERLAVQPIGDRDGRIHGVLIAVRGPKRPPFAEDDLRKLAALSESWAPFIHQLAQQQEAEHVLEKRDERNEVFRQEAIDHLVRRGQRGDVVRVHPGWVRAAYWIVLLFVIGAGSYAAFAQISQYASGPAVVRVTGRTDINALEQGTITALEVSPGQEVKQDQVLARLHDSEQAARLRAINTEFERRLVAYLQSPADPSVRQSLSSLVTERETARASVEARTIRAPHDGIVKAVNVADGQRVEPGKTMLSLVEKGTVEGMSIIAFLPGHERPRIRVGQRLRFTLPSFRGAFVELVVGGVANEVMSGKDAADRYLGDRFKDSLPVEGQVVVVEGQLVDTNFRAEDEEYDLVAGMTGLAEVQLASKSVFETMVPGLGL